MDVISLAEVQRLRSDRRMAGRTGAVRGYGSSLMIADAGHVIVASDRWLTKVKQALGARTERNYGVGGSKLLPAGAGSGWVHIWTHQADRLATSSAGSLDINNIRPPSQGFIGLQHGVNDLGAYSDQAGFQAGFRATYEAIVRMLRGGLAWRTTSGRWTASAGWNNGNNVGFGGVYNSRSTNGGTMTFTTPTLFPGGTLVGFITARPDSNEGASNVTVTINGGATVVTVDTTGKGITGQTIVVPVVVPNVPSGSGHTVVFTFNGVGAGGVKFLGTILESQWSPMIACVNQPATPTMPPPSEPLMTQARLDGVNQTHADVADLFGAEVFLVDLTSMNGLAKFWQDDVHYSPEGHAEIANKVLDALARAGGVPAGYSAGPVCDFAGKPDWSAAPGTEVIYDTTGLKVWVPKSITAGDWVGVAVA